MFRLWLKDEVESQTCEFLHRQEFLHTHTEDPSLKPRQSRFTNLLHNIARRTTARVWVFFPREDQSADVELADSSF